MSHDSAVCVPANSSIFAHVKYSCVGLSVSSLNIRIAVLCDPSRALFQEGDFSFLLDSTSK